MGAGWAVGARLFQVDEDIGIRQVIDRIKKNDEEINLDRRDRYVAGH